MQRLPRVVLIAGVAETTASLLKIFSGVWTARLQHRKPFVLFGYGISGLARPLIGLASLPADILFGLVWKLYGSTTAFCMGAGFAALGATLLLMLRAEAPPAAPLTPQLAEGEA